MQSITRRHVLAGLAASLPGAALFVGSASASAAGQSERKIRIGQIGVGHAHATKMLSYRTSPDYEVVGIVEPDAKLRATTQAQGGRSVFRDLDWMTEDELLNVPDLDAVLVETRVRDLLPTAERCIAAGKHIHLDKPAGESLPHFERILSAAEGQGLLVQMGYMYRYNPAVLLLRQFLKRGWLGEVFEVHAVMSKVIGVTVREQLAAYPGGTMFELGCHLIDLVVQILGPPDSITPYPRHTSTVGDGLVDNMLAVFEYPRATATVRSTALEVEGFARRHLTVCGTEGTFHIQPLDNPSVRVALSKARGEYRRGYQDVTFPRYSRYVADAADMARIIRGQKKSDFSYAHDLAVQKAVLKASGLEIGDAAPS